MKTFFLILALLSAPAYAQAPAAPTATALELALRGELVFDVNYYMLKHPDIARFYGGNVESVRVHWITQGMREGRESSPVFNIGYYKKAYPDVAAISATGKHRAVVEHWIKTGIGEGRQGSENFDVKVYMETLKGRIPDLTYEKAIRHYMSLPAAKQTAFIKLAPAQIQPMPAVGKADTTKGTFHMEVDDVCVLYVNGIKVHKGGSVPSKSDEVSLNPGDRVVAQLKSVGGPRYFKLLFVTSDKRQMINFKNSTFKILPDAEVNDFTPAQYSGYTRFARELKGERNPFPFKNKSEYLWGESDISTLGSIISREMFAPLVL